MTTTEVNNFCIEKILQQKESPLFIAITGDSGSGKSYFSSLIKNEFKKRNLAYTYIDFDDFLIPRKDREPMKNMYYKEGEFKGKSYWEILENMFYLDKMKKVISDLREGKPSTYVPYSRETGDISLKEKTVNPADYIIFDTSMLLNLMDFVILVDVTRENIIKRKLKRDSDVRTPHEIIDMHNKVQGFYWDRAKPSNPDVTIDNNDVNNPKIIS